MPASLGRLTMGRQWRLDIGAVLVYFALGAMFSAAPRYVSEELDGSKALAGFSVSIFFVAAVLARPVVGRLVDRIGRRPFLARISHRIKPYRRVPHQGADVDTQFAIEHVHVLGKRLPVPRHPRLQDVHRDRLHLREHTNQLFVIVHPHRRDR